jgi:4-amino-4-deoxychorismate lyase
MKNVNYLPNALTKVEGEENGGFTGIWLDDEGFVAEGSNMNVGFVTRNKELLMPRFDKILSGCTAKRVLALADQLVQDGRLSGISSRNVSVQEGKATDEMMLIGSGILVKPVVQWDDQMIGSGKENSFLQISLTSSNNSNFLVATEGLNKMLIASHVPSQAKKAQLLKHFSTSFLRT